MRHRSTSFVLVAMAMAWAGARAQDAPAPLTPLAGRALDIEVACDTAPPGWNRVGDAALDTMRGGFTTPAGLNLSLGIERMVSINGAVVSHTNFNIANVGSITSAEAAQASAAINSVQLVQNGANNFALGDGTLLGRGTFVQNSVDGAAIQSQTIISSTVNSASLLKELNFQSGLQDATIRALVTH